MTPAGQSKEEAEECTWRPGKRDASDCMGLYGAVQGQMFHQEGKYQKACDSTGAGASTNTRVCSCAAAAAAQRQLAKGRHACPSMRLPLTQPCGQLVSLQEEDHE